MQQREITWDNKGKSPLDIGRRDQWWCFSDVLKSGARYVEEHLGSREVEAWPRGDAYRMYRTQQWIIQGLRLREASFSLLLFLPYFPPSKMHKLLVSSFFYLLIFSVHSFKLVIISLKCKWETASGRRWKWWGKLMKGILYWRGWDLVHKWKNWLLILPVKRHLSHCGDEEASKDVFG